MTKDLADFLAPLNREGVAYVVIGGIGVLAHILYRTTRDLGVLIEPTLENAQKAHAEKDLPDLRRLEALRSARP